MFRLAIYVAGISAAVAAWQSCGIEKGRLAVSTFEKPQPNSSRLGQTITPWLETVPSIACHYPLLLSN